MLGQGRQCQQVPGHGEAMPASAHEAAHSLPLVARGGCGIFGEQHPKPGQRLPSQAQDRSNPFMWMSFLRQLSSGLWVLPGLGRKKRAVNAASVDKM